MRSTSSRSRRVLDGSAPASRWRATAAATRPATTPAAPPTNSQAPRATPTTATGRSRRPRGARCLGGLGSGGSQHATAPVAQSTHSQVMAPPPGRPAVRSTRARARADPTPRPRHARPTAVVRRNDHGSDPAPEPISSTASGRQATSRAVARAEASSESTRRRVRRRARSPRAVRSSAAASPWPESSATCHAPATQVRSAAPRCSRGQAPQRVGDVGAEPRRLDGGGQRRPALRRHGERGAGRPTRREVGGEEVAHLEHRGLRGRGRRVVAPTGDGRRRAGCHRRPSRPRATRRARPAAPTTATARSDSTAASQALTATLAPSRAESAAGGRPGEPRGRARTVAAVRSTTSPRPVALGDAELERRGGARRDPGRGGPRRRGRRRAGCARPAAAARRPAPAPRGGPARRRRSWRGPCRSRRRGRC